MCTALSLTWSLIYGNIRFKFSSVRLREAAEFRCCSLVALPVSIDVCSNTNHLDTRVTTVCCFGRVVYILIKCMDRDSSLSQNLSFDNTDMEGTACVEWRNVSGVVAHR